VVDAKAPLTRSWPAARSADRHVERLLERRRKGWDGGAGRVCV